MSKTPQFDAALDTILKDLKPHDRTCAQCGGSFRIFAEDIEFYHKLRVPPPTLCPRCRLQRRLGYRISFLPIFYKKRCSAPGHSEKVISYYSEANPVKVYDDAYYLSDAWDALQFGREYNSFQPFFEQFHAFAMTVPHQTLQKDPKSVNCDYVVSGLSSKNCYYVAVPYRSEDVQYAYLPFHSKNSLDVNEITRSERCYESVNLENCYGCSFCYDSRDCLDSAFLYDCRNCSHCFGGMNLRNKKYVFMNAQLTKEEYERRMASVYLGKRSEVKKYQAKFQGLMDSAVRKHLSNVKVEQSMGDNLRGCKNCIQAFRVWESENVRYVFSADRVSEMMDIFGSTNSERAYENTGLASAGGVRFSIMTRIGQEVEYSVECRNCEYVFGCFGLRDKKFCIFNRQYREDEYWQRVDELKTAMLKRGEYGEFFPLAMSPHPYADTNAPFEFPLSKDEVLRRGWHWEDEPPSDLDLSKLPVLKAIEVPDDIKGAGDTILEKVILCEETGKPFRLTKFELDFLRERKLPLPAVHPMERIKRRFAWRHPYRLWDAVCTRCGKNVQTYFPPAEQKNIYCEACYNAEVA